MVSKMAPALPIARQIADALAAAHEAGILLGRVARSSMSRFGPE
jgi:DNA-binding helix-hairpin-helix protein with protein kinase domain